jgi:hypothetical protein
MTTEHYDFRIMMPKHVQAKPSTTYLPIESKLTPSV